MMMITLIIYMHFQELNALFLKYAIKCIMCTEISDISSLYDINASGGV